MASRILDMGDLLTLIEQAERTLDRQEAEDAAAKLAKGTFTLDDFLGQLRQIRKMGSMKKLLGMMPAWGRCVRPWTTSTSARSTASRRSCAP